MTQLPRLSRTNWQHLFFYTLLAVIAALFALRQAGELGGPTDTKTMVTPQRRVSAITVDLHDYDIVIPKQGDPRVIKDTAPSLVAKPLAPLMDWEDRNVRQGDTQVWCLAGADPEAQDIFRNILNQLGGRFTPQGRSGIRWRESCNGNTYSLQSNAYDQCGIGDGAAACAGPNTYCGVTIKGDAWCGGDVSYNGHFRDFTLSHADRGLSPGLDAAGLKTALSHEVQHLLLNLGHVGCGVVLSGAGKPVASVMAPLYMPSGPSCTTPPAAGLVAADWELSLGYYDFGPAPSQPTPEPTPTPAPTPPPAPPKGPDVYVERWVDGGTDHCDVQLGTYCITKQQVPAPDAKPTSYDLIRVFADGSYDYIAQSGDVRVGNSQSAQPAEPPGLPAAAHPRRVALPSKVAPTIIGWDYTTVDTISREADRVGLPPLLILSLAVQEGGLRPPFPTGDLDLDSRGSCGFAQIYVVVHGHDCAYWQDPLNDMREMESRWLFYFNAYGGWDAWSNDQYTFLQNAIPSMQGSISWSYSLARANYWQAQVAYIGYYQQRVQKAETSLGVPTDPSVALSIVADGLGDLHARATTLKAQAADLELRAAIQEQGARDAAQR